MLIPERHLFGVSKPERRAVEVSVQEQRFPEAAVQTRRSVVAREDSDDVVLDHRVWQRVWYSSRPSLNGETIRFELNSL